MLLLCMHWNEREFHKSTDVFLCNRHSFQKGLNRRRCWWIVPNIFHVMSQANGIKTNLLSWSKCVVSNTFTDFRIAQRRTFCCFAAITSQTLLLLLIINHEPLTLNELYTNSLPVPLSFCVLCITPKQNLFLCTVESIRITHTIHSFWVWPCTAALF